MAQLNAPAQANTQEKGTKFKSEKKQLIQIEKARPTLPRYGKYQ
jgi:hypothetical protein